MADIPGVTPSGPTEVLITHKDGVKINQLQAKYQSKEQFVATLASQFYLYAKIDNTNDAIENANKAFRDEGIRGTTHVCMSFTTHASKVHQIVTILRILSCANGSSASRHRLTGSKIIFKSS